jgi:hypothetical protein
MGWREFDPGCHCQPATRTGPDAAHNASGPGCLQSGIDPSDGTSNHLRRKAGSCSPGHSQEAVSRNHRHDGPRLTTAGGSILSRMSIPPRRSHSYWLAVRFFHRLSLYQCRAQLLTQSCPIIVGCWPWLRFQVGWNPESVAVPRADIHSNLHHGIHHLGIRCRDSFPRLPVAAIRA